VLRGQFHDHGRLFLFLSDIGQDFGEWRAVAESAMLLIAAMAGLAGSIIDLVTATRAARAARQPRDEGDGNGV